MFIDEKTEKVLGLDELWRELEVASPFGQELRAKKVYYTTKEGLEKEYGELQRILSIFEKDSTKISYTKQMLGYLRNIKGTLQKLSEGKILDELELFEIKYFIYYHQRLAEAWKERLGSLNSPWKILDIENKGTYDFYLENAYSKKLEKLRTQIQTLTKQKDACVKKFFERNGLAEEEKVVVSKNDEALLKKLRGIKEAKKAKETFSSVLFEFEKPKDAQKIEVEIEKLILEKNKEKYEVMKKISAELKKHAKAIIEEADRLAYLDLLIARVNFCKKNGCTKPTMGRMFYVKEGRNYILQRFVEKKERGYTPLNIRLKGGVSIISGSNMAGKTQTLKTIGQLTAMAQMGLFVPAEKFEFAPMDYIFFSAEDPEGDSNFSTFAKEILRVNAVFEKINKQGLILIDEIARGTNHREAQALSKAIIEELKFSNSFSVITTHLPGLLKIGAVNYYQIVGLKNVNFQKVKKELQESQDYINIIYKYMDYSIMEGDKELPLDALKIAEMMGLRPKVLEEAKRYLEKN